jgi:hypothetical protein
MPSAEILSFPNRAEERLRNALAALDAALLDQKLAIEEFQANIGLLGGAVAGLETSLRRYACDLASTQADVLATREAAVQLEATADGWLRQLAGPQAGSRQK